MDQNLLTRDWPDLGRFDSAIEYYDQALTVDLLGGPANFELDCLQYCNDTPVGQAGGTSMDANGFRPLQTDWQGDRATPFSQVISYIETVLKSPDLGEGNTFLLELALETARGSQMNPEATGRDEIGAARTDSNNYKHDIPRGGHGDYSNDPPQGSIRSYLAPPTSVAMQQSQHNSNRKIPCIMSIDGDCQSEFSAKGEHNRHFNTQHRRSTFWVCAHSKCNGRLKKFHRKDQYIAHAQRLHLLEGEKVALEKWKAENGKEKAAKGKREKPQVLVDMETRLAELADKSKKEDMRPMPPLKCLTCEHVFNGDNADVDLSETEDSADNAVQSRDTYTQLLDHYWIHTNDAINIGLPAAVLKNPESLTTLKAYLDRPDMPVPGNEGDKKKPPKQPRKRKPEEADITSESAATRVRLLQQGGGREWRDSAVSN